MKYSIFIIMIVIMSQSAFSQDHSQTDKNETVVNLQTEEEKPNRNFIMGAWESVKNNMKLIAKEGNNDLYVTGYAYHDRMTYTPEKLNDLNEGAYGGGYGRSRINEKGNTESIYAMSHLDSHKDVQVNVGYAWAKKFTIYESFKVGVGYTAFFVSRSDFAHHIPLPFALPYGTLDIGNYSLNAILIPKLNDGINNGNVVFLFAKFTWDGKKDIF